MSGIEKKTIFHLGIDCLEKILKYLSFEDLISLKETSAGFHHAISINLQNRWIVLRNFESIEKAKAFFREMPFELRKLDMTLRLFRDQEDFRKECLSSVLKEVQLSNVTHLSMDGFSDHAFYKDLMRNFRELRSISLDVGNIEDVNVGLESIAAGTIEKIKIVQGEYLIHQSVYDNWWDEAGAGGASKFLLMLQKHGPRLREFELRGKEKVSLNGFIQHIVNTLSESAPNLKSFKLNIDSLLSV